MSDDHRAPDTATNGEGDLIDGVPTPKEHDSASIGIDQEPIEDGSMDHGVVDGDTTSGESSQPFPEGSPSMRELVIAYQEVDRPRYQSLRELFEQSNGKIREEYFSHSVQTGAALLDKRDRVWKWRHTYKISLSFDSAAAPVRIDDLVRSTRAEERRWSSVLSGRAQEAVVQSLYTVLVSLLNFADFAKSHEGHHASTITSRTESLTSSIRSDLRELHEFARKLARRATLQYYMTGLPVGIIVVALLVLGLNRYQYSIGTPAINYELFFGAIAGAIGAIISVMVRITNGNHINVDYDRGRVLTILIGGFRPIIGAVLAVALIVLIAGGIIPIAGPAGKDLSLFYVGLSFLAGFSERWAQDTIVSSTPQLTLSQATPEKPVDPNQPGSEVSTPAGR